MMCRRLRHRAGMRCGGTGMRNIFHLYMWLTGGPMSTAEAESALALRPERGGDGVSFGLGGFANTCSVPALTAFLERIATSFNIIRISVTACTRPPTHVPDRAPQRLHCFSFLHLLRRRPQGA